MIPDHAAHGDDMEDTTKTERGKTKNKSRTDGGTGDAREGEARVGSTTPAATEQKECQQRAPGQPRKGTIIHFAAEDGFDIPARLLMNKEDAKAIEISDALGINRSTLSRWLNPHQGRRGARHQELRRFAALVAPRLGILTLEGGSKSQKRKDECTRAPSPSSDFHHPRFPAPFPELRYDEVPALLVRDRLALTINAGPGLDARLNRAFSNWCARTNTIVWRTAMYERNAALKAFGVNIARGSTQKGYRREVRIDFHNRHAIEVLSQPVADDLLRFADFNDMRVTWDHLATNTLGASSHYILIYNPSTDAEERGSPSLGQDALGYELTLGSPKSTDQVDSYNSTAKVVDRVVLPSVLPALRAKFRNSDIAMPDLRPLIPGMARHGGLFPDLHRIEGRTRPHKPPHAFLGPAFKPFDRLLLVHLAAIKNPVWQLFFLWGHAINRMCPREMREALRNFAARNGLDEARAERCFHEQLERAAEATCAELGFIHPRVLYSRHRSALQEQVDHIIARARARAGM